MEKKEVNKHKPHCLILPFPIQGHINPMLQFSKRLSHKGVKITIAATKSLLRTIQQDFVGPISLETISDSFDEQDGLSAVGLKPYLTRFQEVGTQTLSELLERLKSTGRPVDCLIYDPFLPWSVLVAKRFGLIGAAFFTQSCAVNVIFYHAFKGLIKAPMVEEDVVVDGLPPLDRVDMPSFVRDPDEHPGSFELLRDQFENVEHAGFVFVNSIYELEVEATDWMSKVLPVKTIGPTIPSMYLDKRLLEDREYGLSIFKPVDTCMKWLDQQPNRSVIYVSFGSMARLQGEEMEALALGLKSTKKHFLWVVRSSEESKLPSNFAQETSEKGLIVTWCPQLEVLAHDAIGCFVTHCGWNSTLEALSLGVPMVAVPWWSDQSTNAKFVMDVWKMGIRARRDTKNFVTRDEIARCIEYVMEGEKGEEMRNNAMKWKTLTREAVDEGGSSDQNIQEFVSILEALPSSF